MLMERALGTAGVTVTTLTTVCRNERALTPVAEPHMADCARRIYARRLFSPYKIAPGLVTALSKHLAAHDVVHIHGLFSFASTVAAWMARRLEVPYIVRPLGTLNTYGITMRRRRLKQLSLGLIESQIIRCAAAVHFTSESELEEARALGLIFRGVVIPLGIDRELMDTTRSIRMGYPALAGRLVVLFLSRLDPKKNVEGLIDAVAASDTLKRSTSLLIAGGGAPAYLDTLKARAAAAGVADHIVWLGHVESEYKMAAMAAADVFALPSFSENFGIAAVEAMLAGLPCVLGQGVAIATEVARAGAGLVVAPNPRAIAIALEQILGNDGTRHEMGKRGRCLAEREYSTRVMAERLVSLYGKVCRGREQA